MIDLLYKHFLESGKVTTDSRNIIPGSIFFALKGASFDGNRYALNAIEQGCSLAVVDDIQLSEEKGCFYCDDVLSTLQELARTHRRALKIPFIGITGTNGKTTTKELVYAVLSTTYKTIATQGNLNNHIGVPLTILSIPLDAEIAIVEMGANHPGEIKQLCEIAFPDFGIITNIGKAHLEGFGGYEGVKKTKKELYDFLKQNQGLIFVNEDNKLLMELSSNSNRINYGIDSLFCHGSIEPGESFLKINLGALPIQTQLIGDYNFENVLAACCIGKYFKVKDSDIKKGIEAYIPKNNRSQIVEKKTNKILMDAYNANPSSMAAAISNFATSESKSKVVILGDMFELGDVSFDEHLLVCQQLSRYKFDEVVLVGEVFNRIAEQFQFKGFNSTQDAFEYLKGRTYNNSFILLKGSRGMKMETLLEAINE